jgi:gas vesicle protein
MAQEPDAIRGEIEDTRERMSETVDALSYKTDVKSRMTNAVSSQKDKLMGTVSDNTPDPDQVKEKAKQGVGIAKENPVALAVGGLALGFLGGLLAPSTRMENEKIGDVSDKVTDTIKETGQEAMERGKSVAQEAVGAAGESGKQEAQKLGEGLKERVQETQAETVHQQ